jgi:hypothetical protein
VVAVFRGARLLMASMPVWAASILIAGCGAVEQDTTVEENFEINATSLYVRASLDLIGRRPTVSQLREIEEDEGALEEMLEELLFSPSLPERMAWIWNDTVHTAVWATDVDRFDQFGEGWAELEARAVGFELPSMLAMIAEQDLPLTELVTADWAPFSSELPELWSTFPTEDDVEGWSLGLYNDARPIVGALSLSSIWMRYNADATNFNRRRANELARIFLCSDYFQRGDLFEFSFSVTEVGIGEAIDNDPSCTTCHSSLDPLGSFLGGFAERSKNLPTEQFLSYSELNYEWYQYQEPSAYFGYPGSTLESLGEMVAADPRFRRCMVETFWGGVTGSETQEPALMSDLEMSLVENDMSLRSLLREIVASDSYAQGERRLLNTEQLANTLNSFLRVENESAVDMVDALIWSAEHRIMGGATDDSTVLQRDSSPSVSRILLLDLIAKSLSGPAIEDELERNLSDRLLLPYDLPMTESEVKSTFVRWFEGLASVSFDLESVEISRLYELFLSVGGDSAADEDLRRALEVTLRAVVQHPLTAVY